MTWEPCTVFSPFSCCCLPLQHGQILSQSEVLRQGYFVNYVKGSTCFICVCMYLCVNLCRTSSVPYVCAYTHKEDLSCVVDLWCSVHESPLRYLCLSEVALQVDKTQHIILANNFIHLFDSHFLSTFSVLSKCTVSASACNAESHRHGPCLKK